MTSFPGLQHPLLWPLLVFVLLTASLGSLDYWYFKQQTAENVADTYAELASVGNLKAGEIDSFLTERSGDARVLADQLRRELMPGWWQRDRRELPLKMQQNINSVVRAYGYTSLLLLDTHGDIRYSLEPEAGLTDTGKALALRALSSSTPVFSQIYFADPAAPTQAMLDTFSLIPGPAGTPPVGILVLRGRWSRLFDLVQTWPVKSPSAESLLVRKDGADVLFLNKLRFQPDGVLSLRFPLNTARDSPAWPAISAVQGNYGALESIDYRGQRVFAYTLPVLHSDWSMVVKVDTDERVAGIHRLQRVSGGFTLLLIALVCSALALWLHAQRRALTSQRANEALLNAAQEAAHIGNFKYNPKTNVVEGSDELYRIFGKTRDQFKFEDFAATLPPDQFEFVTTSIHIALRDSSRYDIETALLLHDGTRRQIRIIGTGIYATEFTAQLLIGTVQDITQQRESEQLLRDSEARYHSVVAALAEGIVLNARDGAITACNAAAERILGLSADQMRGRTPMDPRWRAVHEDGSPFPGDTHPGSVTLRTGQPQVDVVMGVHKPDGTLTWISINSVPIFNPGETLPSAAVASFVDITARKQADLALRLSEQHLKEAQRIGKLGSVDWDLTTNALTLSDEAYEIYGLEKTANTIDANDLIKLLHPDDAEQVGLSLQAAVAGTARHDLEHRMVRPDGTLVYVRATAELFRDSHGKPMRLTGAVLDITERKLAENALKRVNEALEERVQERTASLLAAKQEAERANNAKSSFLSSMSHELRTPMNAILGFSQLIDSDTVTLLAPDHKECVREILHAGDHLLHLINEVLDLAHVESGRMGFTLEAVALTPLIQDSIALMRPLAAKNQLQVSLAAKSSTQDLVRTDRHRVRQVILNLLSNAVKYTRPGGQITIACTPEPGDFIRLSVQDTGHGISADNLPRLFKTFERLEADRYRVDGTGIGLALCKQLIEKMGGRIGVDSTPGIGSTFWFELPATPLQASPAVTDDGVEPEAPAIPSSRRVLFIEDHPANMRLMQRIFTALPNVTLLEGHTGEIGLELAIGHLPEVILLDITLPGIDGYEVLRRLREHTATRHIPVVAVTANATPTDIERGKAAGFSDYLPKPFDVQRLLNVVRRLLDDVTRQK